jgi:hypothetical protein
VETPERLVLPHGLLFNNDRPGHYALCPSSDMTVDEYHGLVVAACGELREDQKNVTLDFDSWETRLVLEALAALDQKWTAIIEDAASKGDEDTAADYGNDALQLNLVQERVEEAAVAEFGPTIKDFSREPIPVSSAPKK